MESRYSQSERQPLLLLKVVVAFGLVCTILPIIVLATGAADFGGGLTAGRLEKVWGRRGATSGRLQKPRAMAIDRDGLIYIVDKTARIQVYDRDGRYLRGWRTPDFANGKPTGLSFDNRGNLMVADTHYFRVLFYDPRDGRLLEHRTMGGTFGRAPSEFGLVTDVVQDSTGCLYVAEYGDYDRIQKFSQDGTFLFQWGGHGTEPGQFIRPQNLAVDEHDHVWVVDACNDRIQVFDATGDSARLLQVWGERGDQIGQLRYPYDLWLDGRGHVYVCEFGNHRVQKFTLDGTSVGAWGKQGRREGELFNPWAIVQDQKRRTYVLDTGNHRVQRIRL